MSVTDLDWQDTPLGPYAAVTAESAAYDEVIGPDGIRDEQQLVAAAVAGMGLSGLLAARAETLRLVHDDGIHYGGDLQSRTWVVDPIPLVITGPEWSSLDAGLRQRAMVLDAVFADLYGPRRLIASGLLPAAVVFGHTGYLPQAHRVRLPGPHQLVITGTDLGRASDGEWFAMSDRTTVPSGAGYAMVNRRITSRVMSELHRGTRLTRLRGFFDSFRMELASLAPQQDRQPKGALLWPGSGSETAYEMGFLATLLGLSLVEGDDLITRNGQVWINAPDGRCRIDVLLRRVDSAYCDPLEFRSDSQLGVPGLLEAARTGRISVANPLGSDVLENPGLMPFLPAISRALIGEDLLLPSAETYWCGRPTELSHVLAHLDELVIKRISRAVASTSVQGWSLSAAEQDELAAKVRANPWEWVGQDPILTSTAPVVTRSGLRPRRVVVRAFGIAASDGYEFMPGGLARVAPDDGAFTISNMYGALSKDVWVLDDSDTITESLRIAAAPAALWAEGTPARPLAPRVADNLHWFGRYAERIDATSRLLRLAIDLSEDYAGRPGTTGSAVLREVSRVLWTLNGLPIESGSTPAEARGVLRRMSRDSSVTGSLAHAFTRLERSAQEVPTVMSGDVWHILARMDRVLAALSDEPGDYQAGLLDLRESTMALFGVAAESLIRDPSWAFIDAGIRLERAMSTLSLVGTMFSTDQPLIVMDRMSEVVMECCDSQITHRRRSAAGIGPVYPPNAAAALLVLEEANPRAVVRQLEKLAIDLSVIGDEVTEKQVVAISAGLAEHASTLTNADTVTVSRTCLELAGSLRDVSRDLQQRHFTRSAPPRPMVGTWLTPTDPRLAGRP